MTIIVVTDFVGDGRLLSFGGRFKSQVWPGDTLTATATVQAIDEENLTVTVDVNVINQDGDPVFLGYATAQLDE